MWLVKVVRFFCVIMLSLTLITATSCTKSYKKIENLDETRKAPIGGNLIIISQFSFDPAVITIYKGEMVTWENMDDVPHIVVWEGVQSKKIGYLEEFKYTFRESGTYLYKCPIHPGMEGKIIVK